MKRNFHLKYCMHYKYCNVTAVFWLILGSVEVWTFYHPLFSHCMSLLAVLWQWFPLSKSELGWKSKRLRLLSIVISAGHRPRVETRPIPLSGSISHRHRCPHRLPTATTSCVLLLPGQRNSWYSKQSYAVAIVSTLFCWAFMKICVLAVGSFVDKSAGSVCQLLSAGL